MKIIAWIIVIWVVLSLVSSSVKEGTGWMDPFVAEYKIQLEERPIVTIAVTVLVVLLLVGILF